MTKQKGKAQELSGFFSTISYCLSLSWQASKFYTIIRIVIQTMTPLLSIVAAFIGKYLIDLLAGESLATQPAQTMLLLFATLLAISLLGTTSRKVQEYCQSIHDDMVRGKLSLIMMNRSLAADLQYFDNPDYHDKLTAATRDSTAVANLLWSALSCISASVSFVGAFLVLYQTNILYGILMMVAAFPSSIAAARYTKSLYRLSLTQVSGERQKRYYQNLAVDREYAQDVRLFAAGGILIRRFTQLWQELFTERRRMMRRRTMLTCLLDYLPEIVVVLIGINIAYRVLGGEATVGDYSLYTGLLGQLWASISQLTHSAMRIYDNQLKISNLKTLDHFQNRVVDTGTKALDRIDTIEFQNVSFTYPYGKVPALDELNFTLRKEEKVALVGLNGSGKSTLIKLLLRLYDPDKGNIKINGTDIREYQLDELRSNFSVYFQDMRNYSFTLRDNLTIADPHREDVDEAATAALMHSRCDDLLVQAGKGLDTNLTRFFAADGIELSGGQHQKLALARALYRRHSALVLDEPSSNLDPKAEHEIFQSLQMLTEGIMTIFTSHRLSNVFLADRIIVLEKGRVIEDGTQAELLKNQMRYAELFRYQQEKYMVEEETDD